jgi:RNA polymerase sigma factor (sigma-70 family)
LLRGLGDEQLTQLVANGSGPAFAVIYDRYMPSLLRYCRRILGSVDDAEDAAQATMVSAMRGLGQRPPRRLRPWLYRIAHNEAISVARRHVHNEPLLEAEQQGLGPDPEQAAATRARLAQLLADLHALPGRQRDALVMRELCGRSYADIAAELGSSEAAAQQAVFEARVSLHEFGKGRELECVEIQRSISASDHARLHTRRVRAHLRACESCASFERDLYARRRDFALLLPWVSATTVPEILGLAGHSAADKVTRLLRTPMPPGGLRTAAVAAFATALGVTGLGLQAVSGAPQHRPPAAARALRFSSPGEQASATTNGGATGTTAPITNGHGPGHKPAAAPGATEGGQTRVPAARAPTGGDAASSGGGSAHSPARNGQGATGGGRTPGLPAPTPHVGQTLGTVQTLGAGAVNGATGAVSGAAGAVQNTVQSVGPTAAGATGTVTSTVQGAGSTAQHLINSLP